MSGDRQGEQEDFLARWSRRKTLSRKGEELPEPEEAAADTESPAAPATQEPPPGAADAASGHPDEISDADDDTEVELPPLESLGEDSDYSAFLRDGVPADMKQKALRKLFHSPKFNIRDGLDDYDLDFSNPEPLGDVITAEMRYRMERELERLAGLDDDEGRDDEESRDDETTAVAAVDAAEHGESNEQDNEADPETEDDRPEPA
jgi:hypothetical protein